MEDALELPHQSHLVQEFPSSSSESLIVPESPDGEEKKKPARMEKEHHKQAFAYYFSLGKDRTLAKVAEMYGVKESLVLNWSYSFEWKRRIVELENRPKEEQFKEKSMDLLILLLDSMVKWDGETGKMALTCTEKTTAEKIKLCIDAFKKLRDDSREDMPKDGENNEGGFRNPGPRKLPRVVVNIIK